MAIKGRVHPNKRHVSSAAAFCGVIGVPDPGRGPVRHDGGVTAFCREFNTAADAFLATRSVECRDFLRNERYFQAALR